MRKVWCVFVAVAASACGSGADQQPAVAKTSELDAAIDAVIVHVAEAVPQRAIRRAVEELRIEPALR